MTIHQLVESRDSFRVFTVSNGKASEGARLTSFDLRSGDKITAVLVGEEGRGRTLGVLPVQDATEDAERIYFARIALSRAGKPKLLWADAPTTDQYAIVVFLTNFGFRGSCSVRERDLLPDDHPLA